MGKLGIPKRVRASKRVGCGSVTLGDVQTVVHGDGFDSIGTHCLRFRSSKINEFSNDGKRQVQVAAFDLDDTLIRNKSGFKFARSPDDWKWFNEHVPRKVKEWTRESPNRIIAIFTNQGAVTNIVPPGKPSLSFNKLVARLKLITKELDDLPLVVYASTRKSSTDKKKGLGSDDKLHETYRKPGIGMWKQLIVDIGDVDISNSFFVGDAAGRDGDFSDSDRKFAETVGLTFKVPEEYFKA